MFGNFMKMMESCLPLGSLYSLMVSINFFTLCVKFTKTVDAFVQDVRLMFNNCRQYNEEGSEIVKDANTLERQLYLKTKEMGVATAPVGRPRKTNNVSNR